MAEIKRRERDAVLNSLQAGLVPRTGIHLIQVGRKDEVKAMLANLESIEQGGAAFPHRDGTVWQRQKFFPESCPHVGIAKANGGGAGGHDNGAAH